MKSLLSRYLLELRVVIETLDMKPWEELAKEIAHHPRLFVAGLGRTGAVMRAFAAKLNQHGRDTHVALEPGTPVLKCDDLLFIGSGSGTTETMVAVAKEAQKKQVRVIVATGNLLSPLGQLADQRLLIPPLLPPEPLDEDEIAGPVQAGFEQTLFLVLDALAARITGTEPQPKGGFDIPS